MVTHPTALPPTPALSTQSPLRGHRPLLSPVPGRCAENITVCGVQGSSLSQQEPRHPGHPPCHIPPSPPDSVASHSSRRIEDPLTSAVTCAPGRGSMAGPNVPERGLFSACSSCGRHGPLYRVARTVVFPDRPVSPVNFISSFHKEKRFGTKRFLRLFSYKPVRAAYNTPHSPSAGIVPSSPGTWSPAEPRRFPCERGRALSAARGTWPKTQERRKESPAPFVSIIGVFLPQLTTPQPARRPAGTQVSASPLGSSTRCI